MAINRPVTLLILASSFIAVANSLKCISSSCATTMGATICPTPAQEIECNQPMTGMQGLPDKCMTLNVTMMMQGVGEVKTVTTNCSYSAICAAPQVMCGAMPNATACTLKCCDTDNCNKLVAPPTQVPQPTGPSGADLSCLECADMPGFPSISCKNPVKRTCGNEAGIGPQDRCLTIKGSGMVNGTLQHLEMRNCSTKVQCAFNMCKLANTTLLPGKISSCDQKCCIGNNCNDPSITTPPPGIATTVGPTASANRFETGLVAIFSLLILAFVGVSC